MIAASLCQSQHASVHDACGDWLIKTRLLSPTETGCYSNHDCHAIIRYCSGSLSSQPLSSSFHFYCPCHHASYHYFRQHLRPHSENLFTIFLLFICTIIHVCKQSEVLSACVCVNMPPSLSVFFMLLQWSLCPASILVKLIAVIYPTAHLQMKK